MKTVDDQQTIIIAFKLYNFMMSTQNSFTINLDTKVWGKTHSHSELGKKPMLVCNSKCGWIYILQKTAQNNQLCIIELL